MSHHWFISVNGRRARTPRWAWLALAVSCWFLIGYHAWETSVTVLRAAEISQGTGPFAARYLLGPPARLAMLLMLWFRFFHHERAGARVFAVVGAFLMLCMTVAVLINQDLHDLRYPLVLSWGLPASATAWLVYAVCGRERMG